MPTKKRAPRMSEEELAADAAAFAQAAMQEDAEVASDGAGDDHAVNADADATTTNSLCGESSAGKPAEAFFSDMGPSVDWGQT